jgi:hypothetical protein
MSHKTTSSGAIRGDSGKILHGRWKPFFGNEHADDKASVNCQNDFRLLRFFGI